MTGPDRWEGEEAPDPGVEEVDALRRLRAADPIAPDGLPDVDSPHARALYQEIVHMSDTRPARSARTSVLAGTTAIVAVLGAAIGFAVLGGGVTEPAPQASGDPGIGAQPGDPGIGGQPGMAMCAEVYSLESLADRDVAFDGTLVAVDGDRATFQVHEVFAGNLGEMATLDGAETIVAADGLSTIGGPGLSTGDRALVSGSDGFVWGCGFTMRYDEATAAAWRDTLG